MTIALTHFRKVATVQNSRLLKMPFWFLVICWQALTVQSIVRRLPDLDQLLR